MRLRLFPIKYIVPGLAATLLPVGIAQAATLTVSDSVDPSRTNFADSVSIPQFDSSLGDLTNVFIELTGEVTGSIQLESLDAADATVTANLASEISLQRPDMTDLIVTLPTESIVRDLTSFDGSLDFGGSSGFTENDLSESETNSATLTDPGDLSLFLGSGNLILPVVATGQSAATGAGNLGAFFNTFASANISVTYEYTERPTPVPEPGMTLGMLALGGGMMAKRKKNKA